MSEVLTRMLYFYRLEQFIMRPAYRSETMEYVKLHSESADLMKYFSEV